VETFTFLFTDIEGSTVLLGRVGQGAYAQALADHHSIIRSGLAAHGGREIDTQGDAFFAVFTSPAACVAAVVDMQRALQAHPWPDGEHIRVRMGVHTGQASTTTTGLAGQPSPTSKPAPDGRLRLVRLGAGSKSGSGLRPGGR
jgi:class 3 adenylate cyclase